MPNIRPPRFKRALQALTIAALGTAIAVPLAAQELRYNIAPQGTRIQWDNDLGLKDANLLGGRFGFTFNQYIGLHGFYLTRSNVRAELSRLPLTDSLGNALSDHDVDIRNFGADLRINVGSGTLSPFLTAGGAVLRFDPDSAPRSSQIALKLGAGVQLGSPGRVRVSIFAEDLMFRLNRYALAARQSADPLSDDPDSDDLRHNLALGAALQIPLGGSRQFEDDARIGLGAVGMPVELFAGRMDFDDETGLARQDLVGARAGLNFGRLVSLRGYYWRGVADDFDDTAPIQSFGGEAQFNLATGAGLVPYLIAGAGVIDFRDDYRDVAGNPRDNRTSLILGGGLALALNEHLRFNFTARDYLFSDRDLADVASTEELRNNWMYSAGFSFNIFARDADRPVRTVRLTDTVRVSSTDTISERDTVFVDANSGERVSAERARRLVPEDTIQRESRRNVIERRRDRIERTEERLPGERASRDYVGDRTIVVPVPLEGELYIRYGPDDERRAEEGPEGVRMRRVAPSGGSPGMRSMEAGAADALREDIRAIIRDELERAAMSEWSRRIMLQDTIISSRAGARGLTNEDFLGRLEQRLTERSAVQRDSVRTIVRSEIASAMPDERQEGRIARIVDDRVRAALAERDARQPVQRESPMVVVVRSDSARLLTEEPKRPVFTQFQPQTWGGYSGFTVNDGSQFVLGGRIDLGAISTGLQEVDLIPELALGVGSGATSLLIGANARYRFGGFQVNGLGLLRPYGSLGLGFMNFSSDVHGRDGLDLVINAAYGLTAEVPGLSGFASSGASEVFLEHQGIGFFGLNRLLAGLTWRY